jgi:general secretion pathway protein D
MISSNSLRVIAPLCAALMLLPPVGLEARTRKGDKLMKLGAQAERRKDYDKALEYFQQALSQDPEDPSYQLAARRVRFEAGQSHVEAGNKLRDAGNLEQALVEFQKAFATDPGSMIALQQMDQTKELLEQKEKGLVPPGQKPMTSAEKAQKESLQMIESLQPVPELKPVTNQISLLKMNNQPPKVLYETVGKLAGINVLFDPQMQPGRNANLDLNNVTLQEALDYIALLTKTFWKPVSENAIFVTEDNVTKRRDYEDEVVKVFYLKNPTSTQEFSEIVTAVRSVTDVRRMFQFNAENAIVVRDTVDKVALVEKLLHDLDKPKAEVVVDVIVMDVASDVSHQIGAGLVSNGTNGLAVPIGFSPRNPILSGNGTGANGTGGTGGTGTNGGTDNGTGTGTAATPTQSYIALGQIGHIGFNDFSTSLPGALLQAVMSDSRTKVEQSPEVRVSDGQKVSLKIGQKYPYATGSFQPGVGTVGVSPLVSTQFQFVDTGVNVEMTPHVHGSDELTLHVSVDISNVSNTVNLGGLSQPVISQKKNEADIRLKDGEVSLLGGLMQSQDTSVIGGIPGLVNIPVLGKYLFGNTSKDKQSEQLMIALIPHIVRKPDITGVDLRGIAAGTDQTVKLSYGPRPEDTSATPPSATAPEPAASVTPATPGGAAGISFNPPSVLAQLSSKVVIALQGQNLTDVTSVPVKVRWDPKVLRLEMISPGALLTQDGKITAPSLDIRNDTGDASIEVNRLAGAGGVTGTGPLLQLTFTAVGKGTTAVRVTDAELKNTAQQPVRVGAPSVSVTVQ